MEGKYTSPHTPVDGCRFCVKNGELDVIAHYPQDVPVEAATALLVLAKDSHDDHLVIPGKHGETEDDLPGDFTVACNYLRKLIPWMSEATADPRNKEAAGYHTGTNYGASAGQTVVHVHQWYSLVPEGFRVVGIASYTRDELRSQDNLGMSLRELLESSIIEEPEYARA